MKSEISKEQILSYLNSWSCFDSKEIVEEGEAYTVILKSGEKSVALTTPYEVGEFFIDFLINEKPYYSDWYEIMEDPLPDFMSYTKKVVENFLFNEVRVKSSGWWIFKGHDLEYRNNGTWYNVFQ